MNRFEIATAGFLAVCALLFIRGALDNPGMREVPFVVAAVICALSAAFVAVVACEDAERRK